MEKLNYTKTDETDTSITNTKYDVQVDGVKYTVIGDNIKADFDFLIKDIPNMLEEARKKIKSASEINDAFMVENGAKVNDLMNLYEEINKDIDDAKNQLNIVHSAFMTDIDNINAELEYNFGDIELVSYEEAGREVIEKNIQE